MHMRLFLCLLGVVLVAGCQPVEDDSDCPTGSESCECTSGGACDMGLSCMSGMCVNPNGVPAGGTVTPGGTTSDNCTIDIAGLTPSTITLYQVCVI